MTSRSPVARRAPDQCPGLIRAFGAANGALMRLRIPGGRISCEALAAVAKVAVDYGTPIIQLTSRGNLQLRGLPVDATQMVEAISTAAQTRTPRTSWSAISSPLR